MGFFSELLGVDKVSREVTQNSEHIQSIAVKIAELVEANKLDDERFLELLKRFEEFSGATKEQMAKLIEGLEKLSGDDEIQELSVKVAEMANSDTMMIAGIAVAGGAVAIMAGFIAFCIYQVVKQEREAKKESESLDQVDLISSFSKNSEIESMPRTNSNEPKVEQPAGPERTTNGCK